MDEVFERRLVRQYKNARGEIGQTELLKIKSKDSSNKFLEIPTSVYTGRNFVFVDRNGPICASIRRTKRDELKCKLFRLRKPFIRIYTVRQKKTFHADERFVFGRNTTTIEII